MSRIPLSIHQAVKREVDAAYRITTRMYGRDAAWNVSYDRELDLWRKKAGQ